jgi:hypothetical protein
VRRCARDSAVRAARECGADVIVAPFDDPIGRDAVVQWPGGVNMQLYWHTTAPSYATLQTIPNSYLGPIIRAKRGQKLRIHFNNALPEPTIVHWHGLHAL